MIKFDIATEDLRYIFDSLKPAVAKTDSRPVHTSIKFAVKDNKASAYAVDGYRLHSVTVPVMSIEGNGEFSFMIKPFTVPKTESCIVSCELSEKEIMFNFGERKFIERVQEGEFLDVDAAIPKSVPITKIGFNAAYLMDAAKTLKGKDAFRRPIVMEIFSPLLPVMIYKDGNRSDFRMVLPVRIKSDD